MVHCLILRKFDIRIVYYDNLTHRVNPFVENNKARINQFLGRSQPMIPAEFDYARPTSVTEAVAALGAAGEDAKLMAGGQSLIPILRLRLAYPSTVVDVSRVQEMRGVRDDGDAIVIGAMTTHDEILRDALVQQHAPLRCVVADALFAGRGDQRRALPSVTAT